MLMLSVPATSKTPDSPTPVDTSNKFIIIGSVMRALVLSVYLELRTILSRYVIPIFDLKPDKISEADTNANT